MTSMDDYEKLFCPDCNEETHTLCENNSFDHEFGTEHIYDFYCLICGNLLKTVRAPIKKSKYGAEEFD